MRTLAVIFALTAASASADTHQGLGYACHVGLERFVIYPLDFGDLAGEPLPETENTVLQRPGDGPGVVASCAFDGTKLELRREFQNSGLNKGICGAAPWVEYRLHRNGEEVARFFNRCFESFQFLSAGKRDMTFCAEDRCAQLEFWQSPRRFIRGNLVGDFQIVEVGE